MNPSLFKRACILAVLLTALAFSGRVSHHDARHSPFTGCEIRLGGIVRGPSDSRRLALVFTGHDYAEGAETILDELARHQAQGSFFLTGAFLTNRQFAPLVRRMWTEGHYLGPHSDAHLLYCDWSATRKTLVTREQFAVDIQANAAKLPKPSSVSSARPRFFLPAFEQYNAEIARWSAAAGFLLVNFTPGTRSNADYTGEAGHNFVSSQAIFDSILKREREDPHGLNGFILLLHLGSGPGRADKFSGKFGALLDELSARGYQFVRVDELLAPQH
jgi:peptidoglycan/xylan/chitin deacetylase (PgdA/CDA1 family)